MKIEKGAGFYIDESGLVREVEVSIPRTEESLARKEAKREELQEKIDDVTKSKGGNI